MNNMIKKLILLILIFIIVLIGINIYTSLINTHSKEYESDIISKSNADLVLLDINLPMIDGEYICKIIELLIFLKEAEMM